MQAPAIFEFQKRYPAGSRNAIEETLASWLRSIGNPLYRLEEFGLSVNQLERVSLRIAGDTTVTLRARIRAGSPFLRVRYEVRANGKRKTVAVTHVLHDGEKPVPADWLLWAYGARKSVQA